MIGVPRWAGRLALGAVLVFFAVAFGWPVGAVLWRGLSGHALADPSVLAVARATVRQAAWSTFFSAALGLPIGLWAGSLHPRLTRFARACLAVPYGVPTIVAASAWVLWLGRTGWLARAGFTIGSDWSYTMRAVILAHAFLNIPLVALLVAQTRMQIPARLLEAAQVFGAGTWNRFRFVLWPEVRWALGAAMAQVFGLCSMSFALVLVLGGGPPVETLETSLYARIRFGSLDVSGASACAIWEMAITLGPWVALVIARQWQARRNPAFRLAGQAPAIGSLPRSSRIGAVALGAICLMFVVPYLATLISSPPSLIFSDHELAAQLARPLVVSLELSLGAALGAVGLAGLGLIALASLDQKAAARRFLLVGALSLPSSVSILVVGLGFWFAYGGLIDPFSGSLVAMLVLQITLFAPMAFRMLWPLADGVDRRLLESAATLGASPLRAFWFAEWPRWKVAVFSALGIVAAASLGEVAAVSLFFSENLVPLPLLITRWMAQYRFHEAEALAGVLLCLSLGTSWAFAHISAGRTGYAS